MFKREGFSISERVSIRHGFYEVFVVVLPDPLKKQLIVSACFYSCRIFSFTYFFQ